MTNTPISRNNDNYLILSRLRLGKLKLNLLQQYFLDYSDTELIKNVRKLKTKKDFIKSINYLLIQKLIIEDEFIKITKKGREQLTKWIIDDIEDYEGFLRRREVEQNRRYY